LFYIIEVNITKDLKDIDYQDFIICINEDNDDHIIYQEIKGDYKYAQYWSNNWRKNHALPLRRKPLTGFKLYVKAVPISQDEYNELEQLYEELANYYKSEKP
jgi:hypothetical protein